jgi:hypothetical protein
MTRRKWGFVIAMVAIGYGLYGGWFQTGYAAVRYPVSGEVNADPIDASKEPAILRVRSEPFTMRDREGKVVSLTPVTGYSISGRVAAQTFYPHFGDPCSFGELPTSATFIAFGKVAEPKVFSGISADAGSGGFSVRFDDPSIATDPGTAYIQRHLTGNMLIAANGNIDHAIRRIRIGDVIRAKGDLVNVKVSSGSEFRTSVGPEDFGTSLLGNAGANEILYVTELSVGGATYR